MTDSVSWSQRRYGKESAAHLTDRSEVWIEASGRPPRNEEDALEVCERLIRCLNNAGGRWRPSQRNEHDDDVDVWSEDEADPSQQLLMQVTRIGHEQLWGKLGRHGAATEHFNVVQAADELLASITKKTKYPADQRVELTLVIDAGRTPTHTFQQVIDDFKTRHQRTCATYRFAQVWLVGPRDELVIRLDQ